MFNRDDYLAPRVLQTIGLVALAAQAIFWAVTGQSSNLFVGPCVALIFLGQYQDTVRAMRRGSGDPPPPMAPAGPERDDEPGE